MRCGRDTPKGVKVQATTPKKALTRSSHSRVDVCQVSTSTYLKFKHLVMGSGRTETLLGLVTGSLSSSQYLRYTWLQLHYAGVLCLVPVMYWKMRMCIALKGD